MLLCVMFSLKSPRDGIASATYSLSYLITDQDLIY